MRVRDKDGKPLTVEQVRRALRESEARCQKLLEELERDLRPPAESMNLVLR
jgi:hypothetical protein